MAFISNTNKPTLEGIRQRGNQYYQPTKALTGGRNLGDYYGPKPVENKDRSKLDIPGSQNVEGKYGMPTPGAGWKDIFKGASVAGQGTDSALQIPPSVRPDSQNSGGGLVKPPTSGGANNTGGATTPPPKTGGSDSNLYASPPPSLSNNTGQNTDGVRGVLGAPQESQLAQFTGGLMDASKPNQTQQDYLDMLRQQSMRGEEIARQSAAIGEKYGSEIDRVGKLGAGAVAGAKSTGTDVVGRGNAQLASESASNRIASLSAAQAAELQGVGQQLTGAELGVTGLTSALGAANTQQQLGQQALQAGGGLAMPSPAQYGQTVFDPVTAQYTGAGGQMDPSVQAPQLAQQVMSGAMTYGQAVASLGYAPGGVGQNFLNNAITQAGGNPLELEAQGASQQANITTEDTAASQIARQGLENFTNQYMQLTADAEVAHSQAQAALDILAQTDINNQPIVPLNRGINELRLMTSDPEVQAFVTAVTGAQSMYNRLMGAGGQVTPTEAGNRALQVLNSNAQAPAIAAAIEQLDNEARRLLQSRYNAMMQFEGNLGGGSGFGDGGQTGGGQTGGGGQQYPDSGVIGWDDI